MFNGGLFEFLTENGIDKITSKRLCDTLESIGEYDCHKKLSAFVNQTHPKLVSKYELVFTDGSFRNVVLIGDLAIKVINHPNRDDNINEYINSEHLRENLPTYYKRLGKILFKVGNEILVMKRYKPLPYFKYGSKMDKMFDLFTRVMERKGLRDLHCRNVMLDENNKFIVIDYGFLVDDLRY